MQRLGPTTDLSGIWEMQPEKTGLDIPKDDRWARVPVPMPWTAFLARTSGVPLDLVPNRMAWFRRRVVMPDLASDTRLMLHFEAVNFYAVVFVDGKRCGEHAGDAIPFDVDITDFVMPGDEAEVRVGVQDISYAEGRGAGRGRAGDDRRLVYPGLAYHPGIWGPVSLRVVPELHIVSVRIQTALPVHARDPLAASQGRMRLSVSLKNETGRPAGFSLTNEVYDGARQAVAFTPVRGVVGPGELTEIEMGTAWDSATLWWPDAPHLYQLRTALWAAGTDRPSHRSDPVGEVVDRAHTRFGFREFRIDGDQFMLNHVPVQLRSESLSPVSGQVFGTMRSGEVSEPVAPGQAVESLAGLKRERGLNAVRFHRIPPSPALLDAADQVGLLAVVEFPLPDDEKRYAVDNPTFWVNTEALALKWVLANGHHPSLVMWSIDQGMVRHYGRGAADPLKSLARAVADVDPTRPVETSGDADQVDIAELMVEGPYSVFFPATGVAFRTAGPYEPQGVRGRVVPGSVGAWPSARPTDRPLCLLEHRRRALTPNALAFFLGDTAYGAGVNLVDAAAPLALIEMGAARIARAASVNTVGRSLQPSGITDSSAELAALPATLFANFYAGTQFVENLVLRNDTRFDQDCQIDCRFTTADGNVLSEQAELFLPAGSQEKRPVAFQLSDVRKVYAADSASSALAELTVRLTGSRAGSFEHRRKIAVWPHVRTRGRRRIGLYDPDGQTAAALSAVGSEYTAAHGTPHDEFDTIIIGQNALEHERLVPPEAIRSFVSSGGLAVVLPQRTVPYDLSPVTTVLDEGRAASITFVRDAEHRALLGLSSFEMRWWQEDHCVAGACFRKPAFGNFRCLVDAGGPGGLVWATALEVFHGRGSYLFSQMDVVTKTARAPVAGLLLARLADTVPSWRAVHSASLAGQDLFAGVGAVERELRQDFRRDHLSDLQVLLLTGSDLAGLSPEQLHDLRHWTQHGGCLFLHHLTPGQEKPLSAVTDHRVDLVESPQERLVFNRPGLGLARGLSSADLYFRDHAAKSLGEVPRTIDAASVIAMAKGSVTGVASAIESPLVYGLTTLHAGKGRVIIDQVRWDIETASEPRAARYISTLLTNLGVRLEPGRGIAASAACAFIDISAACNSTLADAVPGDGEGWTDRGPDSDLSGFPPGLLIAGGMPFRVAGTPSGRAGNCCVLGPGSGRTTVPITVGRCVRALGFLVTCQGHVRPGEPVGHFTLRYSGGLERQIPLRYGVDVLDWNERGRPLKNASVAWKGFTLLGEPAVVYAKKWEHNRPEVPVESLLFSSARTGTIPILLAITAEV